MQAFFFKKSPCKKQGPLIVGTNPYLNLNTYIEKLYKELKCN
jgi:hypothetical protein